MARLRRELRLASSARCSSLGAVLVAGTGALARWWRLPAAAARARAGAARRRGRLLTFVPGSPLPVGDGVGPAGARRSSDAVDSANRFAPPVPGRRPARRPAADRRRARLHAAGRHPGLHPAAGAAGRAAAADDLQRAGQHARRRPVAGGSSRSPPPGSWRCSSCTRAEQIARWGRSLGRDRRRLDPERVRRPHRRRGTSAGAIGGVATALAIVVPLADPDPRPAAVRLRARARGGDDDINIDNPMVDLRRDLIRGEDDAAAAGRDRRPRPVLPADRRAQPVHRRRVELRRPRRARASQTGRRPMPALDGRGRRACPRDEYDYERRARPTSSARTWLPTQSRVSRVEAAGDWRYDMRDDGLPRQRRRTSTPPGSTGTSTAVELDLDAERAGARRRRPAHWSSASSPSCPPGSTTIVRQLATRGHRRGTDPLREGGRAAELVPRRTAASSYTHRRRRSATAPTTWCAFLAEGHGGRTGYCEQFAAAMAVMARDARHPRPGRGRLPRARRRSAPTPASTAPTTCTPGPSSTSPAPAGCGSSPPRRPRASGVPDYTDASRSRVPDDPTPTRRRPGADADDQPDPRARRGPPRTPAEDQAAGQSDGGRLPVAAGALGALALVLRRWPLVAARPADAAPAPPRPARLRRRPGGRPGPSCATPRVDLRRAVAARPVAAADRARCWCSCFGAPPRRVHPGAPAPRPRRPTRTPSTRSTGSCSPLERLRYARDDGTEPGILARRRCRPASRRSHGGARARARRGADWWPRSVFDRRPTSPPAATTATPSRARRTAGVVDHVG